MEREKEPIEEAKIIEEVKANSSIITPASDIAKKKKRENITPRITNALTTNIASKKNSNLYSLVPKLEAKDIKIHLDRRNKPFFSTPLEDIAFHALEHELSQYREDEDIKELKSFQEGGLPTVLSKDGIIVRKIDLYKLALRVYGDSAEKYRDKAVELLQTISNRTQYIELIAVVEGIEIHQRKDLQALVVNRNSRKNVRIKQNLKEGTKSYKEDSIEVGFLFTFFQRDSNSFCPILDTLYDKKRVAWNNDLFTKLLAKVESLHYHQKKEGEKVRNKMLKDLGKRSPTEEEEEAIALAERKALTYILYEYEAKSITATNYSSNTKMQAQFWKDLEESIRRLINYTIITSDSKVDKENKKAYLVINKNFGKLDKEESIEPKEK